MPVDAEPARPPSTRPRELGRQGGELFRQLIDSAPDAMVVMSERGTIELVNMQTERLFGYQRAELVEQLIEILIPERFWSAHVGHRSGFVGAPKTRPMGSGLELFGRRRDGTEFPIEISLSPLDTQGGLWVSAAIRDITDRRRTEATARLASDRLLSAVESIQGMLALYDAEDRLVLCNSACRELFAGVMEGPIVGRSFSELLAGGVQAGLFDLGERTPEEFLRRCLEYRANPEGVLDLRTQRGQNLRLTDRRTLEGGVVSTIRDTTVDMEHEAELKRARALAETANSAKSEFLSSMSHELRTPLNSILGFTQLLQRDKKTPLTGRQQEMVEYVLKGGEHLLRLIDDILDLSSVEAGRVIVSCEPVGVASVLAEVRATLAPMATRLGVRLVLGGVAEPDLQVLADRTRVCQVLINFGSNALKYGRTGGNATFAVCQPRDGLVRISVVDDGFGIPFDKQDKIFQPFQRAGQEAGPIEGTGIGLAITRRLAELMAGSVGFRSRPDVGSEFWIELPLHDAKLLRPTALGSAAPAVASPTSTADARYTVVYIEDNPSNVAFMRSLLEDIERVGLLCVPTAEVGIEVVRAARPDLVIMDMNLPGMSGYEATRRLREWPETRAIPVIALTAAAMIGDHKRVTEAGFQRYLTKPVRIDELLRVLDELLPITRLE
jgi:PAS domain S-box-containing protein